MSRAQTAASPPIISIEDALAELQHLVFQGAAQAAGHADDVLRTIALAEARARLLAAMAAISPGDPQGTERLTAAIERVQHLRPAEPGQLLELAVAQLVNAGGPSAVSRTLASSRGYEPGRFTPLAAAGAVRYLLLHERVQEAEKLLLALLPDPGYRMPADWPGPLGGGTAYTEPDPATTQLLTATLAASKQIRVPRQHNLALARLRVSVLLCLGDAGRALDEIAGLLQRDPADARTRRAEVIALTQLGRYENALTRLRQLPPAAAPVTETVAWQIRLLIALGRTREAVDVAKDAARSVPSGDPDDTAIRLMLAEALAANGLPGEALELVDDLLARFPGDSQVLTAKGRLLRQLGDLSGADAVLEEAVKIAPDSADARVILARVRADQNKLDSALAQLDEVPPAYPLYGEALLTRARILASARRPVKALEVLDNAERVGVAAASLYAIRGDLMLELDREAEARSAYERGLTAARKVGQDTNEFVRHLEDMAQRLYDQSRYEEAVAALALPAARQLLSPQSMGLRAELLRITRRWHEALAQADEALRASPEQAWIRITKAATLIPLSRAQEALDLLEPIVDAGADHYAISFLISALDAVDRPTDALARLRRHFGRQGTPSHLSDWATEARASLCMNLAQFPSAVRLLKRAIDANPDVDRWKACLAVAYSRLGDPKRAVETWQSITSEPDLDHLDGWECSEFADALCAEATGLSAEATAIYRHLLSDTEPYPVPVDLAFQAWAALRLGEPDDSISRYRQAIAAAADPFRVERSHLAIAQFLAGRPADGVAMLDELLADVAQMADTARAAAIVTEIHFAIGMLERAPARPDYLRILPSVRRHMPPASPAAPQAMPRTGEDEP